jgi:hypothetical protein
MPQAQNGRFHAAIISGLIEGHDVFYAQWHDVPHTNNPDLTARHAIALLLNGDASTSSAQVSAGSAQALAGHVFFIYDNISDPAQLVAQGYTIGIADKLGSRGVTYAYAPCCGDARPPQGYPPAAGTTLHLRPFLFGADNCLPANVQLRGRGHRACARDDCQYGRCHQQFPRSGAGLRLVYPLSLRAPAAVSAAGHRRERVR